MKDRLSQIHKHIRTSGEVLLSDLVTMFPDVSAMTIRRDLDKLAKMGEIVRTHGGAKSIEHLSRIKEELYSKRAYENVAEKKMIARKAHSLIKEGQSLFLDSGTTVTSLAGLLTDERLFIVTTAPNIALECSKNPNASIYMTGGNLNKDNLSLSGINALSFLDNINIDTAFIATSGFSFKNFFSCGNYDECQLKKQVIKKAAKVVMFMDSSKLGRDLPFTFAKPSDIDILITDDKADNAVIDKLHECEVDIL